MAKKKNRTLHPDEPLLHADHSRPVTRRQFLQQGFISGSGAIIAPSIFGMLAGSTPVHALSGDMNDLKTACGIQDGAGKIPFICFDLAGGANFAGSNVLVGGQGGIEDSLTTAGYNKLGIRGDTLPSFGGAEVNVDRSFGLPFHSDSAMLQGMKECYQANPISMVNGAVIPARSDNDTGNNPHNPMYGIHHAGARGHIMSLIGSRNSDSGGNSMAPASLIDLTVRPTKIDRQSDVLGLVDTGDLATNMGVEQATSVMESIQRISAAKMQNANISTGLGNDSDIKEQVECNYVKSAYMVEKYGTPSELDVDADADVAAAFGSNAGSYATDREMRKTASVMKMVVGGLAGAGTVSMGGYDYHTGDRTTGETRDLRAGRCIGACLRYAELKNKPIMIYVCSDGSLASNGMEDPDNGKLVWTGDNSSTACSFFLVYNPGGVPELFDADSFTPEQHQQLGYFRPDASVETNATPAANNVNLLVETVILNYIALHGDIDGSDYISTFLSTFTGQRLGSNAMLQRMTAFKGLAGMNNGIIANNTA